MKKEIILLTFSTDRSLFCAFNEKWMTSNQDVYIVIMLIIPFWGIKEQKDTTFGLKAKELILFLLHEHLAR